MIVLGIVGLNGSGKVRCYRLSQGRWVQVLVMWTISGRVAAFWNWVVVLIQSSLVGRIFFERRDIGT